MKMFPGRIELILPLDGLGNCVDLCKVEEVLLLIALRPGDRTILRIFVKAIHSFAHRLFMWAIFRRP